MKEEERSKARNREEKEGMERKRIYEIEQETEKRKGGWGGRE